MNEPLCTALAFVFCGIACFLAGLLTGLWSGAKVLEVYRVEHEQKLREIQARQQRKETNHAIN